MLAKLTAKNQITLPKRALDVLGAEAAPAYFEVAVEEGRIILTPARVGSADAVRRLPWFRSSAVKQWPN